MDAPTTAQGQRAQLAPYALAPSPHNPRRITDADPSLKELAESIRSEGLIQPIVVRKLGEGYEIVAGERRWRACRLAGLATVDCIVRDLDDKAALAITVTENLQRKDIDPLSEGRGVASLLANGWKAEDVAGHLGKSPAWVYRRASLAQLTAGWQERAADPNAAISKWSAAVLELIARLPTAEQDELLQGHWCMDDQMTVDYMERKLAGRHRTIDQAPFSEVDATLVPEAGACICCAQRSNAQPTLFDDVECAGSGRCLAPACWERKCRAHADRKAAELKAEHGAVIRIHGGYEKPPKDTVKSYEVHEVKKGTAGAVPAVVVTGDNAGKTTWVMPPGKKPPKPRSATEAGVESKDPKKAAAARRELLAAKRLAWIASKLREDLSEPDNIPMPSDAVLFALAGVLGTEGEAAWTKGLWKQVEALCKKIDDGRQATWEGICEVLILRLTVHARNNGDLKGECQAVAELLSLTWVDLEKNAAEAIPESKPKPAPKAEKKSKAKKGAA